MADVNTAFRGGMAIYEIRRGEDVAALSARVARRYHVSGDSPSAIPAGPLDDLYPDRRMVLVCEDVYSTKEKKLMIFLYGIWADKFEFAKVNNYIQIWGGENIVLDYHAHAHGPRMADCCICISDRSEKDENGIEIETLDSKVGI